MNKILLKSMAVIMTIISFMTSTITPVFAEGWEEPSWEEPVWQEETWQEEVWVEPVNPYFGGYQNCTWSAWQIAYETTGIALPNFGSAGNWLNKAASMGYTTSNVPVSNSIVVWSSHVGYVSAVSEDGSMVYIREGGYNGGYHEGWFPAYYPRSYQALYGYIYLY